MSLVVKNVIVNAKNVDIRIEHGVIQEISENLSGEVLVDARSSLALPAFVDAHVHLDKCFTHKTLGSTSFEILQWTKPSAESSVYERAKRALAQSLAYGTLAHRAFVDVDSSIGLSALKEVLRLKRELKNVTLQVVAFPQYGFSDDKQNVELLHKAMEEGADVVGGIPWIEPTGEDSLKHIEIIFDIAERYAKDIHIVSDDTDDPLSTNLLHFLSNAKKRKFFGKVAASQCRGALDSPNQGYTQKVLSLAKQLGVTIVENAHTTLMLSGRGEANPVRRGVAPIKLFLKEGVNVAAGQDDIQDAFYPFEKGSMLEVAFLLCHAAQLSSEQEVLCALDAVTTNGAKMMKLNQALKKGCDADLVILNAKNPVEALCKQEPPLFVIRKGRVVARNTTQTELEL